MDRRAERRDVLLRAARHVFATRGYHLTKIDDIVAAADVAKGTFYLYFRDKRSVFEELVDHLVMKLRAAIIQVDVNGDVIAQVKHNIRAILAILLEKDALTPVLLSHAAGLEPAFVARLEAFHGSMREALTRALEDGQAMGIVAAGDAAMLATFSMGALREVLLEAYRSPEARSREEIVEALFGFFERGFLRVGASGANDDRPVSRDPQAPTPRAANRR
jgi:AcrR family transcriptional regulator